MVQWTKSIFKIPKYFQFVFFPFFLHSRWGAAIILLQAWRGSVIRCSLCRISHIHCNSMSLLNTRRLLVNIINTRLSLVDTLSPLSLSVTASMCSAQILHDLNNSPQLYLRTTHIFVCLHFF